MDITVLVCTYNRADDLRALLESVLAQETHGCLEYEVLVVDNNSSDHTREVVEELIAAGHSRLRYLFEVKQGLSEALNAGLAATRGEFVQKIDDDQLMPPGYLAQLVRAFRENPDVAFIGGKVLPIWEQQPPHWLTREHWSPLGMADYGDEPFIVDEDRPVCLLTGAFRTADLLAAYGFRPGLGVSGREQIGGQEDSEIQERLLHAGRVGLYLPALTTLHRAHVHRLTKEYHVRWHKGHGRFSALRRDSSLERARARLAGVPSHLYRSTAVALLGWVGALLRGESASAVNYRMQLAFFQGFFKQRRSDERAARTRRGGSTATGSGEVSVSRVME